MVKIKRIYEKPSEKDGYRIYVDKIWARGLKKEDARIDLWLKDIAPSGDLRKWFGHDPKKWGTFQERYKNELEKKKEAVEQIKKLKKEKGTLTLLYSAKDEEHNNAVVLRDFLNFA